MPDFSDWSELPGLLSVPQGDLSEAIGMGLRHLESMLWKQLLESLTLAGSEAWDNESIRMLRLKIETPLIRQMGALTAHALKEEFLDQLPEELG